MWLDRDDAGPIEDPGIDRIAQVIGDARRIAEIAHGGEALMQYLAPPHEGLEQPLGRPADEGGHEVGKWVVGVDVHGYRDVRVHIDQARHHPSA